MPRLKIKEIALSKGIKITRLAELSGQTSTTMHRYWHDEGIHNRPNLDQIRLSTLAKIAAALGVKASDLIVDE